MENMDVTGDPAGAAGPSRRELRQERKQAEQRERSRQRARHKAKKTLILLGVVALLGFVGYGIYRAAIPSGEDLSVAVIVQEPRHISPDARLAEYSSNPPTSGDHFSVTAKSGFREEEIPDQNIIHNLEHGDVWISFHPSVSADVKETLKQFGAAKVIITPRGANDTDIALAAWGRLDKFDLDGDIVPVLRIKDFIKRHLNKGPERVPGASGGI